MPSGDPSARLRICFPDVAMCSRSQSSSTSAPLTSPLSPMSARHPLLPSAPPSFVLNLQQQGLRMLSSVGPTSSSGPGSHSEGAQPRDRRLAWPTRHDVAFPSPYPKSCLPCHAYPLVSETRIAAPQKLHGDRGWRNAPIYSIWTRLGQLT